MARRDAEDSNGITVRVHVENDKAIRALIYAHEFIDEIAESQSWNPEAAKALRAIRYACKHLIAVEK